MRFWAWFLVLGDLEKLFDHQYEHTYTTLQPRRRAIMSILCLEKAISRGICCLLLTMLRSKRLDIINKHVILKNLVFETSEWNNVSPSSFWKFRFKSGCWIVSGVLSFMIATHEIITKWSCGGDYTLKTRATRRYTWHLFLIVILSFS